MYVITKKNGNRFLPSSMKQVILKQKMKNHLHDFVVVVVVVVVIVVVVVVVVV